MYKVIISIVEGRSVEDYTVLRPYKTIIQDVTIEDANLEFVYEIERHKSAGGEVVKVSNDRAFFINESNEPYQMLDIIEA